MRWTSCVLLALCGTALVVGITASAAETPLTNGDVVKLVALGLGDDVVVAKVRQAPVVAFALDPDALGDLKAAGVSSAVITAMLDRSGPSPGATHPLPTNALEAAYAGPGRGSVLVTRVELVDGTGTRALPVQSGELSHTNYLVGSIVWFNVNDSRAATRSSDRAAYIRVHSAVRVDEVGALVRLDSNDTDRSLRIGGGSVLSFRGALGFKVDRKWVVPNSSAEAPRGVWELRPREAWAPGEYGFYVKGMQIFSFGID